MDDLYAKVKGTRKGDFSEGNVRTLNTGGGDRASSASSASSPNPLDSCHDDDSDDDSDIDGGIIDVKGLRVTTKAKGSLSLLK